ncbi:uncharacterized protein LOC135686057 [Rhopilema esculentum]|uniref:uncharacterized protein LOC135686057 n=1 Tax=Rhopilema esculentum TaxID=499914 RepID=UPI0031DAA646
MTPSCFVFILGLFLPLFINGHKIIPNDHCKLINPPRNGALVCHKDEGGSTICSVACQKGFGIVRSKDKTNTYDFYMCTSDGLWYGYNQFTYTSPVKFVKLSGRPWPDCSILKDQISSENSKRVLLQKRSEQGLKSFASNDHKRICAINADQPKKGTLICSEPIDKWIFCGFVCKRYFDIVISKGVDKPFSVYACSADGVWYGINHFTHISPGKYIKLSGRPSLDCTELEEQRLSQKSKRTLVQKKSTKESKFSASKDHKSICNIKDQPRNGALTCYHPMGRFVVCTFACRIGFDKVRSKDDDKTYFVYTCSADGTWYGVTGFGPLLRHVNLGVGGRPWPDCAKLEDQKSTTNSKRTLEQERSGPGSQLFTLTKRTGAIPRHFATMAGPCNDVNTQLVLKAKFNSVLQKDVVTKTVFCQEPCKMENVFVNCPK